MISFFWKIFCTNVDNSKIKTKIDLNSCWPTFPLLGIWSSTILTDMIFWCLGDPSISLMTFSICSKVIRFLTCVTHRTMKLYSTNLAIKNFIDTNLSTSWNFKGILSQFTIYLIFFKPHYVFKRKKNLKPYNKWILQMLFKIKRRLKKKTHKSCGSGERERLI